MSKKKKIGVTLAIVLPVVSVLAAVLIVIIAVSGKKVSIVNRNISANVNAVMNDSVEVPEKTRTLQRKYSRLEEKNGVYTLYYKNGLPSFFAELSEGQLFCIPPDKSADHAFFIHGFSGKVISKDYNGEEGSISFVVPDVTELFTDLNVSLANSESKIDSMLFIPAGSDVESGLSSFAGVSETPVMMSVSPAALAALKIREVDSNFDIKKGNKTSLLDGYAYICEELKVNTKTDCEVGPLTLKVDSKVILEDLAIKSDIAYHTDEATGQVVVDSYDIGVISKHKLDMTVEPAVSAGLDDIGGGLNIIDFKDATDAEDGKMVLGTFLIGFSVPFLESDTNKVSYLSLGIAVQLTVTAEGELSLECNYKQEGYSRIEADSEGRIVEEVRGYDFPNPVVTEKWPSMEQLNSQPEIHCTASGELRIHAGLGIDVGVCIFGTVPLKISNNIVDVEYVRSDLIYDSKADINKKTDVCLNGYMVDSKSEFFKVSTTSFLRLNVGFESDLDVLNITSFDIGAEVQLLNKVLYQYPDPVGFSKEQCDFGGIQLGENYTSQSVKEAYKAFRKDTNQYSVVGNIKDSVVNNAVSGFIDGLDIGRLTSELGVDLEEYLDDYELAIFSSGAVYIMDDDGTVICQLIAGKDIMNTSGLSCGTDTLKSEMLYSVPTYQESAHIDLGAYGEYITAFTGIGEGEVTLYVYETETSDAAMALLYANGELKLIFTVDAEALGASLGY
ncbi:MAG: hypothetical protein IKZ19_07975 [Clostridia bacterium]|nr:hypothetical protein [Clostridia bacterium]